MGVVVDTCVWVDIERGRLDPAAVAKTIDNEPVFLTPTILAELQYGVERAVTATQRAHRLSSLARLRRKPCLIIDQNAGELFGCIAAELDRQGRPSRHRIHDLWIAVVAIQHGYRLLTRNESDFADIPGIQLIVI